jgi:hypothetical protein
MGTAKRQRSNERTRGGGSMTRDVLATSRQTCGKRGERRCQRTQGSGVLKAGGALRLQKVEVARQEDERKKRRIVRTIGRGGGKATRGNDKRRQDNQSGQTIQRLFFFCCLVPCFMLGQMREKRKSRMHPNMSNLMIF